MPIVMRNAYQAQGSQDVPLFDQLGNCFDECKKLTDSSQNDHMPILPLPHKRQNSFDDTNSGEEIDLKKVRDQRPTSDGSGELLDCPDKS
jgi:hypothetical protein